MYFKFNCSNCGKSLKVREDQAGKKAHCPYCHATVPIPAPPPPAAPASEPASESAPHDGSAVPVARARRRSEIAPASMQTGVLSSDDSDGTNVSLLWTALIALGVTVAFYLLLLPFKGMYLYSLFYERNWIPYAEAYFFFWTASIQVGKWRKLRRQRDSMLFDVLPSEISEEIDIDNVDRFIAHARSLPVRPKQSFLLSRVLRGLEHFKVRKSNPEAASILNTQADIDGSAVDSSYSIMKVFIWAIPILGFIGTSQGLGGAVGQFTQGLKTSEDIAAIKDSLSGVTRGLGVAFDTSLIALAMSLVLSIPASYLQKGEDDLLNSVGEYCNENLLKRLRDPDDEAGQRQRKAGPKAAWETDDAVRAAVQAAMAGELGLMLQQLQALHGHITELQRRQIENLDKAITSMVGRADQTQHDVAKSMMEASGNVQKYFEALERGIASLNVTLHYLGEKQVVIQAPAKKSWWPFGKS